jgi:hypothetical protein
VGALKVWDGSTWQTVSQQGPAGTAPVTSVDTRTGAVTLSDLYVSKTDPIVVTADWSGYTPTMVAEGGGSGLTPGVGGYITGAFRMIAPYTLAVRTRLQWGSSGGNGGSGPLCWTLPPGYSSAVDTYQYVNNFMWVGDANFFYAGMCDVLPNDVYMRPRGPWAGPADRFIGHQGRVQTSATMFPIGWYPGGGLTTWGFLNVQQRT